MLVTYVRSDASFDLFWGNHGSAKLYCVCVSGRNFAGGRHYIVWIRPERHWVAGILLWPICSYCWETHASFSLFALRKSLQLEALFQIGDCYYQQTILKSRADHGEKSMQCKKFKWNVYDDMVQAMNLTITANVFP